ncbi:MAG TPA: hypothetical protein VHM94_13025 [Acidimicrobiia bacterium]|jgi:hypothetical protein|nr:hypothetical protein [Acidimicrobiia bacterium]
MDDVVLVAVEVPLIGDERHKNWAKVVTNVDGSRRSGWAFEGDFVATGGVQDVPAGSVLLVYGERGSRANPQIEARVYRANSDGTLTLEAGAKGRAWARTLRDPVSRLIEGAPPPEERPWSIELAGFSEAALVDELERRGRRVRFDPS